MYMDEIERPHFRLQCLPHGRRPVESPQGTAGEVGHLHPFNVDRATERDRAIARAIDIGREDMNVVTAGCQLAAERVHRPDGAPIAYCGQICRDYMEEAQKLVPRLKFVQFQYHRYGTNGFESMNSNIRSCVLAMAPDMRHGTLCGTEYIGA